MKLKLTWMLTLIAVFSIQITNAQQKTISGVVLDGSGLPLPGATIVVKGTTSGTSSDFDGNYSIQAKQGEIVVFSFVGYTTQEITIGASIKFDITMLEDAESLEEVVITGYGTKKRGDLSSSVSTVSAAEIEKQGSTLSIDKALQGSATGVQVTAQNGKPGNAAFVRIRGIGSINAGSEPLYLLDGTPVDEDDVIGINPSDIKTMSVLKDAASTAIYGARGSNGVVIITTKNGTLNSGAVFRIQSSVGVQNEIKKNFRVMNAREKLEYERATGDPGQYVGSTVTSEAEWNRLIALDHDWSDDIFKESKLKSVNFSVSGGEEKLSYFMSVSNDSDTGIIRLLEKAFERTSARLNLEYQARDWIKISTRLGFSTTNDQDSRDRNNVQNPVSGRYTFNAYEPVYLYEDNGDHTLNIRGLPKYNKTHSGLNSLAQLRSNEDNDTNNRWFGSASTDIRLHENLHYKFAVSGTYIQSTERHILHSGSALDIIFNGVPTGATSVDNKSLFTRNLLNTLTYNKVFNEKHNISATVLTEYYQNNYERSFARGEGFVVNGPTTLSVAAQPNEVIGSNSTNRLFSLAASADYIYDDKYIINGTIRRDGSSRFGANTKFGTFWGASAAWNINNEDFFQPYTNIVNTLKFRISAGTSGNDQIGLNPSQTTYGFGSYNGQNASAPDQFGDPNLGWEESFTTGAGIEFGLFNSKITGVIDYYKRKTTNLLLDVPLSATQNGTSIIKNVGEIENSGFEFELRANIIRTADLNWSVGASLSLYDNKVNKLADGGDIAIAQSNYTTLRVGENVHSFYLARYVGVNPANGQALFLDANGNVSTSNDGAEVLLKGKSPYAKFDGGLSTNINYKGLYLDAYIYYKGGNYIYNVVEQQLLSDGTTKDNQRVDAWNYWKQPGDVNVLPDPTSNNPYRSEANGISDRFLQKGDFIRLKNLQIGYNVPAKYLDKVVFTQVKVYLSGTNLWTYTPWYKGDPEVGIGSEESYTTTTTRNLIPGEYSLNSYPTLSSVSFGVDIKF